MRKSEIKFIVELDDNNVPETIFWEATDSPTGKIVETKSIAISLWDHIQRSTLRIDLWSKDMPVDDMKQFCIESIGSMADGILNATGDEKMASEMRAFTQKLVQHIESEQKK
jgi:gliding motility-associated protein GldC